MTQTAVKSPPSAAHTTENEFSVRSSAHPSSFRDSSGFMFTHEGTIYRQVQKSYREHYDHLMSSGLYSKLVAEGLLVPHEEVDQSLTFGSSATQEDAYKVLKPEQMPFISYPYEWCFSQLKQAGLLTLEIQKIALQHGMILKDASAYNVQFVRNKPLFIDTLSFEKYDEGRPWIAYRQFCEHFVTPLSLMSARGLEMNSLLKHYLDGIPVEVASKLLPLRTKFQFGLLTHVHLHARAQRQYSNLGGAKEASELQEAQGKKKQKNSKFSLARMLWLMDNLSNTISKLKLPSSDTEWGDYYSFHNYNDRGFTSKKEILESFVATSQPSSILDIGANNGFFSRIAGGKNIPTLSTDIDPLAVEQNFLQAQEEGMENIYPLLIDICNPSPGIGWENAERDTFIHRAQPDLILALALIHHLTISNNVPFQLTAEYFSKHCKHLVIEFVGREDSQVMKLLEYRNQSSFEHYNMTQFEADYGEYFNIEEKVQVSDADRTMYLMRSKL